MFPKPKEKGQGLVEYALLLVLVAIVVIAALMILGPIINSAFSPQPTAQPSPTPDLRNENMLKDAPRLKNGVNHPYLIDTEDGLPTEFDPGCVQLVVNNHDLKVGTLVPYLDKITITRDGENYTVCNNIPGTKIVLYLAYLPELR